MTKRGSLVTNIKQSLSNIEDRIKQACKLAHREEKDVKMLAVSKSQPIGKIQEAHKLGLVYFGENYAQELIRKNEELQLSDIKWAFIGHLQSNKIRKIVEVATEIHTVASVKHAKAIDKAAKELNKAPYPIWIAINIASEEEKNGCHPDEAVDLWQQITSECPNLAVKGVMAVPPQKYSDDSNINEIPDDYQKINKINSMIGDIILSLGMSGDLITAIRAGSNIVRVGRDLFGERPKASVK